MYVCTGQRTGDRLLLNGQRHATADYSSAAVLAGSGYQWDTTRPSSAPGRRTLPFFKKLRGRCSITISAHSLPRALTFVNVSRDDVRLNFFEPTLNVRHSQRGSHEQPCQTIAVTTRPDSGDPTTLYSKPQAVELECDQIYVQVCVHLAGKRIFMLDHIACK